MLDFQGRFFGVNSRRRTATVPPPPPVQQQQRQNTQQLRATVRRSEVAAARILLKRGANANSVDESGRSLLWLASWQDSEDLVRLLVEFGANANLCDDDGDGPLAAAARNGSAKSLEVLLASGADAESLNLENQNALWHAASMGHTRIVSILSNSRLEKDSDGNNAIAVAASRGRRESVEILLQSRKDADLTGCLHLATFNGHVDVLRVLLQDDRSNVEENDSEGRTPLWLAARDNQLECARVLFLEHNANANAPARSGRTVYEIAQMYENADILQLFDANERMETPSNIPSDSLHHLQDLSQQEEEPTSPHRQISEEHETTLSGEMRVFDELPMDLVP